MNVYCRCPKCEALQQVDYQGKGMNCTMCGELMLKENDERITDDYVCEENGQLNVIGDEVDEFISKTESNELDKLFGELMEMEDRLHDEELSKHAVLLEEAKPGDTVKFGKLHWVVLDVKDGKKLLLSKECTGLDFEYEMANDEDDTDIFSFEDLSKPEEHDYRWETCEYRKYLNEWFINKTFSPEEKARIATTSISIKDKNGTHSAEDKMFLLNKEEVLKYFPNQDDRIATMHVMYNDVKRGWLLRIDDYSQKNPDEVLSNGELDILPEGYVQSWFRPAMWVK